MVHDIFCDCIGLRGIPAGNNSTDVYYDVRYAVAYLLYSATLRFVFLSPLIYTVYCLERGKRKRENRKPDNSREK